MFVLSALRLRVAPHVPQSENTASQSKKVQKTAEKRIGKSTAEMNFLHFLGSTEF
jgi:hypothetical protein